tara:strand:+ start:8335 stop:8709 length:375 start_codon:yes stop_codon:yes gene_type:complete
VLLIFSITSYSADYKDSSKFVINSTSHKIYVTYHVCIYFEDNRLCSKDKNFTIAPSSSYIVDNQYHDAFYEIKKISNLSVAKNFATYDDVKSDQVKGKTAPLCNINHTVISQYSNYIFCEQTGE